MRPSLLNLALAALLSSLLLATPSQAGDAAAVAPVCHHALSLVGAPKMPPDYKNFDWVNPDAPKGGTLRLSVEGTFDTLNTVSDKGVQAAGLPLLSDSLMANNLDEPSTTYGLIAECVSFPDDFSSATFKLRKEAKFHDGTPVTADDVIFSFEQLKKVNAFSAFYYKNVVKAEKTGDHEVTFTFDAKGNRELPLVVGQISIVSKAYWEGKDATGEQRDLGKTTVEPPLSNGPYKIKSFETGRRITYERVPDYWAKDLPVARGQFNFDTLDFIYYRDRTPAFEDFKAGRLDAWFENTASDWATKYDFEALTKGLVKKEAIEVKRPVGMQAFVFNLRRKQFQDVRVRQAFNLLFNFEEANKKLFYGLYKRTDSYFDNSELASQGLPQGRELEILNEVKAEIPPEVFSTEWKEPVNTESGDFRKHQLEAMKLFNAAGWTLGTNRLLKSADGTPMVVEILLDGPTFERIALFYKDALEPLGIKVTLRVVDSAQYKLREDKRDFDMILDNFGQSDSPGNEQRQFWGSAAADKDASRNTAGIKNPAIDKLIDKVVFAKDRDELVAATHALDRVLLWNYFVVPNWHYPFDRVAYWDIFGRPAKLPSQTAGLMQIWWIDDAKFKAIEAGRKK